MTAFSDRFGGTQIQPADVAYRYLEPETDQPVQWPPYATMDNVLAKVMDVFPVNPNIIVYMPDAREASPGESITFYNNSGITYFLATNTGQSITSVVPGARRLIVLTDNTTRDGSWLTTLLGVGTGALDVAGSAGAGLQAVGLRLNVAFPVITVPVSRSVAETDRAHVLVWTGGTGVLTLPAAASLTDFNIEVRNQGTGALTLQPTGQTIDGVSAITLNVDESLWLHSASALSFWTTIGRGRNTQFSFTQLQKTVTGGTVVLTLTEAANVVQTYTGVLTSNCDVVFPSIVQVYFVSNFTTGAFNLRFKNVGAGTNVSIPQGQSAILFSDGINVINAATTTAGVTQVAYGPGTVSAPSVSINGTDNGFFSPNSGAVSFSASGVEAVRMAAASLQVLGAGTVALTSKSTASDALLAAERPAGANGGLFLRTGTSPRWFLAVTSAAESGSNVGSNFQINRYNDAGVLIDAPMSIDRASGNIVFNTPVREKALVGQLSYFVGGAIAHTGYLFCDGSLVSRASYPDLWAYAQAVGATDEGSWAAGYSGYFSVGNGSTTFRIPDLRGVFLRGLDNGRGLDPSRPWGYYQDQQNLSHAHGVNDPSHIHGVGDPGHAHSIADPGHAHGASADVQGTHQHGYTYTNPAGIGTGVGGAIGLLVNNTQGAATDASGAHGHNISIAGAGTGIGIYTAGTGVYLGYSGTGVSIQASGGEAHPRNMAYPLYMRY